MKAQQSSEKNRPLFLTDSKLKYLEKIKESKCPQDEITDPLHSSPSLLL